MEGKGRTRAERTHTNKKINIKSIQKDKRKHEEIK
jgi:hypothetical protein